MGKIRNGARLHLDLAAKLVKLSQMRGFRAGLTTILGEVHADDYFSSWEGFRAQVQTLLDADDYYNRLDTVPEIEGDEDLNLAE